MVSMLEDMLLRYNNGKAQPREALLVRLDDRSMRTLRLVSRILHDLIDHDANRMFNSLFVSTPRLTLSGSESLKRVAPFCQNLVIRVDHHPESAEARPHRLLKKKRPAATPPRSSGSRLSARERWHNVRQALVASITNSTSSSSSIRRNSTRFSAVGQFIQPSSRPDSSGISRSSQSHLWMSVFSRCQQLQNIAVSTIGEPGWPGRTEVEDTLVHLRVALESVHLPMIRSIRLAPIHAMGIVHLRWSGFGVFDIVSVKASNLWSSLHTLNMQIQNPFLANRGLSESQQVMFKKILCDYLRSFSATLRCLRFVWTDDDGPSPFTLDLEPGLEGCRQHVVWTSLEQVCLGNIALPHRTIRYLRERTKKPGIQLKMLRTTHRHSRVVFDDAEAWVEVLLDFAPHGIEREMVDSQASSLYSQ